VICIHANLLKQHFAAAIRGYGKLVFQRERYRASANLHGSPYRLQFRSLLQPHELEHGLEVLGGMEEVEYERGVRELVVAHARDPLSAV